MHRSEQNELAICSDCGTELRVGTERGYGFGVRGVLCWDCALRRGGRYDEAHEQWVQGPRIDDLGAEYE